MQGRLPLVVPDVDVGTPVEQVAYTIDVPAPVAARLKHQRRPATLGMVDADTGAVRGKHRGDLGRHPRPRHLGLGRVRAAVDERAEDVGPVSPHRKPDQPVAVRPRVGTARQQRRYDVGTPRADGIVQRGRTQAGIVLRLLLRRQPRFAFQVFDHRFVIAKERGGVDVCRGAPLDQAVGRGLMPPVSRRAVRGDLDQERCEVAAAGVDVGTPIEQVVHHFEPSPVRRFPQQGAAVRTDASDPRRLLGQHGAYDTEIAPTRGCRGDSQKVAGFPGQDRHRGLHATT